MRSLPTLRVPTLRVFLWQSLWQSVPWTRTETAKRFVLRGGSECLGLTTE